MRPYATLSRILVCCLSWTALCWTAGWVLACGDGARSNESTGVAAEPPKPASAYIVEGTPGPWWRDGARREDFDLDLRTCRGRSSEARKNATEDPPDAAYRVFVECMDELAWTRGAPPRRSAPDPT